MVAPRPSEPLLLYLAATPQTASAVLMAEREEKMEPVGAPESSGDAKEQPGSRSTGEQTLEPTKGRLVQCPMYFVSTVLREAWERYHMLQKLLYTLLIASRKLRHYFQEHNIKVITEFPLEGVLHNPNATGRMAKWGIELQAFNLEFVATKTIKSRALADFVAEWMPSIMDEAKE